jgi:predicted peroxiredoxin
MTHPLRLRPCVALLSACLGLCFAAHAASSLPPPVKPLIPDAYGWVVVPNAAIAPQPGQIYHAIFSATAGAPAPDQPVPALVMAGAELNALGASGLTAAQADFVIDFHSTRADDALLDQPHYRKKFGSDNPNLPLLAELRKAGVKIYVCAQQLLVDGVPFEALSPDVVVAADGLIVLMNFQNRGYALLPF